MKLLLVLLSICSMSLAKEVSKANSSGKSAGSKKSYQRPYGMAGCGLGSIVINRQGSQVLAGTTNGTAYNQLFGITSGTSNCIDEASSEVASKMDKYIHGNKAQLEGDVVKGQGETIVALSQVMGCSESANLGQTLKANYQAIFSGNQNTNIVTDNIITLIQNDEVLSAQCKLTI